MKFTRVCEIVDRVVCIKVVRLWDVDIRGSGRRVYGNSVLFLRFFQSKTISK